MKKTRSVAATVAALMAIAVAFVAAPSALGAAKFQLLFVNQPRDTEINATIRSADLNQQSAFVQVKLVDGMGNLVTNKVVTVGFSLATGPGLATGQLNVTPQATVGGIATFGEGTLSIGTLNEVEFTHYRLIPITTKGSLITGPASDGFNIWEDGQSCGTGETCTAVLRGDAPGGGEDTYTLNTPGTLGASEVPAAALPGMNCAGQKLIFAGSVFENATTEPPTLPPSPITPVFLTGHITRADFRAAGADFGQAHVDWCVALPAGSPGLNNGGTYVQQDTNGDGTLDLYVGFAIACPNMNPGGSAPCIDSQLSDGAGGNITTGWLPGGDPPRRT